MTACAHVHYSSSTLDSILLNSRMQARNETTVWLGGANTCRPRRASDGCAVQELSHQGRKVQYLDTAGDARGLQHEKQSRRRVMASDFLKTADANYRTATRIRRSELLQSAGRSALVLAALTLTETGAAK